MLIGIQLIGLIFGLVMLYITFLNFKRKDFTPKESVAWAFIWIVFILMTIIPQSFSFVKDILNISRVFDSFVIMGLIFLIGANYYIYSIVRRNQKNVELVVRKVAINNGNRISNNNNTHLTEKNDNYDKTHKQGKSNIEKNKKIKK